MKQFSNEITYASMLGGFNDALDKEKVEKNLNERGYETPNSDLWHQIVIVKNGKMEPNQLCVSLWALWLNFL